VHPVGAGSKPVKTGPVDVVDQVTAALVGLGWSEKVAAEAAAQTAAEASEAERASVAPLLRRTLALLGPARV